MNNDAEILNYCDAKYPSNGIFEFHRNSLLSKACNAPESYGVYLIFSSCNGTNTLVYIGKSGTVQGSGEFKDQNLSGRIKNKQDGVKRQEYFIRKIDEENIDKLIIKWYVTANKEKVDLPGYVEGVLMQMYFDANKSLPKWNKEY
jgi:hypothetical protein